MLRQYKKIAEITPKYLIPANKSFNGTNAVIQTNTAFVPNFAIITISRKDPNPSRANRLSWDTREEMKLNNAGIAEVNMRLNNISRESVSFYLRTSTSIETEIEKIILIE